MATATATAPVTGSVDPTPSPRRALGMMLLPAVLLALIVTGYVVTRGGAVSEDRLRAALPYLIALNHALVLGVLLYALRREGRRLSDLGWRVPAGLAALTREIGTGIGAGVLLYLFKELVFDSVQALVAGNQPTFTTLFNLRLGPAEVPLLVVATTFVFVEESVYRGYGLGALLARWGRAAALVAMAGLFGLLHWGNGPVAVVYTAVIGLAIGGLFLWRRSLWTTTLAHALYNALVILT